MKIISTRNLTEKEQNNIIDILKNCQCPNEALMRSIEDCKGLRGNVVVVGSMEGKYLYHVDILI